MKPTQKQTIYDIAQKAGASASTVSAALNGTWKVRRIRHETASRIQRIAEEQGYSVNLQARGLRTSTSGQVAMILPEHDNRFFSYLSQTFASEARIRGHFPIIVSTRRDSHEEMDAVASLVAYSIDALFIVGASSPDRLSRLCHRENIPHVFVDQPCALAPSVVSDNRLGAMLLTDSLLSSILTDSSLPRKRLYFLGGNSALYASSQRILGFTDALNERGYHVDPAQIIACGYDKETARQNLQTLYEQLGGLPSGLLINSLDCLEGSLAFLGTLPEEEILDCTIGCYDYDPFGTLLRIPMNMIRQRSSELIRKAYSYIDDGVREPTLSLVEPELMLATRR